MTAFWFVAALLIALALALILPALLAPQRPLDDADSGTRDNLTILREQLAQADAEFASGELTPAQHAEATADLQRRALDEESRQDRPRTTQVAARTAVLVALAVPALALALYGVLGDPQALVEQAGAGGGAGGVSGVTGNGGEVTVPQVEEMVARLAQRLEESPAGQGADPQAWEMLARSYAALARFPEASRAYTRAAQLAPANAQLLADHADLLAMMQNRNAEGEPMRLIRQALAIDPNNLKALALAGSAAYARKDFASALDHWGRALTLAPPGSDFAQDITRSIADARQAGGSSANAANAGTVGAAGTAGGAGGAGGALSAGKARSAGAAGAVAAAPGGTSQGVAIHGVVQLAPALAARVSPGDTVFIFARAAEGPRMPLAVLRRKASELPIRFTLDDSMAMTAELQLSRFAQVIVGARITRTGNAAPQSGDLLGQAGPVPTGGAPLNLTIDTVEP